jgi:hypothetical protein
VLKAWLPDLFATDWFVGINHNYVARTCMGCIQATGWLHLTGHSLDLYAGGELKVFWFFSSEKNVLWILHEPFRRQPIERPFRIWLKDFVVFLKIRGIHALITDRLTRRLSYIPWEVASLVASDKHIAARHL